MSRTLCVTLRRALSTSLNGLLFNKSYLDDNAERPLNAVKSDPKSDSSIPYLFPIRCKPYQCLYYLGDTDLPLEERLHNLGSKYPL